jgi:hemolysin III
MTTATYPSVNPTHRRADIGVHIFGLAMILGAGGLLISTAIQRLDGPLVWAVGIYILCALASNLASWFYHFSPWHDKRVLLRRIDHAAIYPSITGTFTPFFVVANTNWTLTLLCLCWALTLVAIWNKITNPQVKSRWSTASYLALGALGLCALPDMGNVPIVVLWCILLGALCYVIGTGFYARKTMPFRYAIWHAWVNLGGIAMFIGIWLALFPT